MGISDGSKRQSVGWPAHYTAGGSPSMIRAALIGYGYAGRTFHAPLIRATRGLELAAIGSSRAEQIATDLPGVPVMATAADAIAIAAVDLVVVATPNDTHVSIASAA